MTLLKHPLSDPRLQDVSNSGSWGPTPSPLDPIWPLAGAERALDTGVNLSLDMMNDQRDDGVDVDIQPFTKSFNSVIANTLASTADMDALSSGVLMVIRDAQSLALSIYND